MNLNNLFTTSRLNEYTAFLKSTNLSDASLKRKLSSLSSFQKFLVKKKLIQPDSNPLTFQTPSFSNETIKKNIENSINQPELKANFLKKIISRFIPDTKYLIPNTKPNNFLFRYITIFSLFAIGVGLGFTLYQQAFIQSNKNLAYSNANNPVKAGRFLSFQGRLTDSSGNPIVAETEIYFQLWNKDIGGTMLYTTLDNGNSQTVIPDENGIFSITIGKSHGPEIPADVFSENAEIWLEITVDDETMEPRQPIATVAYALNAETLQGLPPDAGGYKDTVLVIDSEGNLNLGETSPTIKSISGTMGIEGQAILIKSSEGSGGNIDINPDGQGIVQLINEASDGSLVVSNTNLIMGNLITGQVNTEERGYNFIDFQNKDAFGDLTSRFSVNSYGDAYIDNDLTVSNNADIGGSLSVSDYSIFSKGIGITGNSAFNNNLSIGGTLTLSQNPGAGKILQSDAFGNASWVDNNGSGVGVSYFSGSGLTLNNDTFKLGGALTENMRLNIGNTEAFYIQNSTGNIGLGTTNPTAKLSVVGDIGANQLNITTSGETFGPGTIIYSANSNLSGSINTGDFNNDGKTDLIINDQYFYRVRVFTGNGDGTYQNSTIHQTNDISYFDPSSITIADFNNDNYDDFAITSSNYSDQIIVFINNQNSDFDSGTSYLVDGYSSSINSGDFNGDGFIDLLTNNPDSNNISVFLNNNGTFGTGVTYFSDTYVYNTEISDFNSDGKDDLIYLDGYSGDLTVVLSNNGTFGTGVTYPTNNYGDIEINDFNFDGKNDFVVYDGYSLDVYLNNNGTFNKSTFNISTSGVSQINSGDFNGDDYPDLVTNTDSNNIAVLINNNGTFESNIYYPTNGDISTSITTGDFDSDNKDEIVSINGNTKVSFFNERPNISIITDNIGNIGIGTTSNSLYKLTVVGDALFSNKLSIGGTLSANYISSTNIYNTNSVSTSSLYTTSFRLANNVHNGYILTSDVWGNGIWTAPSTIGTNYVAGNGITINSSNQFKLGGRLTENTSIGVSSFGLSFLGLGNTQALYIASTGRIGIGTTSPSYKLHVIGNGYFSTNLSVGGTLTLTQGAGANKILQSDASGNASWVSPSSIGTTYVAGNGITLNSSNQFKLGGNLIENTSIGISSSYLRFTAGNGSTEALYISNTSRVGIGTTNPLSKLSVVGSISGDNLVLAGNVQLNSFAGFNNYLDSSGGLGTGGIQRITSTGNLTNISSIQAGQLNITSDFNFSIGTSYPINIGSSEPSSITSADFNGDGKPDLATANGGSDNITIFINNGNGAYSTGVDYSNNIGSHPWSITSADFNSDGKPDLATANGGKGNITIFTNNGDGTFGTGITTRAPSYSNWHRSIISADFNSDGKPDLATANTGDNKINVYLNNGNGNFINSTNYSVPCQDPSSITSADFNGDGKPDLVTYEQEHSTLCVLTNNGGNSFIGTTNPQPDIGYSQNNIISTDFNGDSKTDLIVTSHKYDGGNTTTMVNILNGIGNSTFGVGASYQMSLDSYTYNNSITTNDFNGDGKPDIATQKMTWDENNYWSYNTVIIPNNGDNTFGLGITYPSTYGWQNSIISNDFNSDGKDDLAYISGSTINVNLNNSNPTLFTSISGNVGIGTSNPLSKLSVIGDASISSNLSVGGSLTLTQGAQEGYILTSDSNGNAYWAISGSGGIGTVNNGLTLSNYQLQLGGNLIQNTSIGVSSFGLSFLSSGDTQALYIASNGSIGIGTTNPTAKLSVVGNAYFADNVDLGTTNQTAKLEITGNIKINSISHTLDTGTTYPENNDYGRPWGITSADFNGDNKIDIATVDRSQHKFFIFNNTNNGNFDVGASYYVESPTSITTGNFNNDDKPDLAIVSWQTIGVFTNDGSGNFDTGTTYPSHTYAYNNKIITADFNNDSKDDIAVSSYNGDSFEIFTNDGSGNFGTGITYPSTSVRSIASDDLDGDGKKDLVTFNNGYITIFTNDGSGNFDTGTTYSGSGGATNFNGSPMAIADFNNDSFKDIATLNNDLFIFTNDGSGNFGTGVSSPVNAGAGDGMVATDLDGDGRIDLVSTDNNNQINFLKNNGNHSFSKDSSYQTIENRPIDITSADFNNDGFNDIATANVWGKGITVFLNKIDGINPTFFTSNGGFVGIGTTNPTQKLDIVGDINLTGTIFANNTSGSNGQILSSTGIGLSWINPSSVGTTYTAGIGLSLANNTFHLNLASTNTWTGIQNFSTGATISSLSVGGTLSVTGNSTFTNNLSVGGTLSVTGRSTFSNGIGITGNSTFTNNLSVGNTLFVNSKLKIYNGGVNTNNYVLTSDNNGNATWKQNIPVLYTSSNGITLSGTEFKLGGRLTENTSINVSSSFLRFTAGNGSTEALYIANTGRIGLGTTSPSKKLDVVGDINLSGTIFATGTSGSNGQVLTSTGAGLAWIDSAAIGTSFSVTNGLSSISNNVFGLGGTLTQNTSIGVSSSFLKFTAGNGSTEALYIANTGRIGLGTTSPSKKLDVVGDINLSGTIFATGTSGSNGQVLTSTGAGLAWIDSAAIGTSFSVTNGLSSISNNVFGLGGTLTQNTSIGVSSSYLRFTAGSNTESLYISNTGRVGIGTASPSQKLHVIGDAYFASNVGFGVASPTKKIDVAGDIKLTGKLFVGSAGTSGSDNQVLITSGDSLNWVDASSINQPLSFMNGLSEISTNTIGLGGTLTKTTSVGTSSFDLFFLDSSNNKSLYIASNGNIGIGNTTSQSFKLHVTGDTLIDGITQLNGNVGVRDNLAVGSLTMNYGSSSGYILTSDSIGNASWIAPNSIGIGTSYAAGNGLNISNNQFKLGGNLTEATSIGISSSSLRFTAGNGSTEALYIASDGKIGIGTTAPTSKLTVIGGASISTNLTIGGSLVSVGSTNLVTNLNAQYLGGIGASEFVGIGQTGDFITTLTNGIGITITGSGVSRNITFDYDSSLLATGNKIGLNLGSSNTWTGLQSFNNINIGGTLTLGVGASAGYVLTSDESGNAYWAFNPDTDTTYTAGNGITLVGTQIKLGGTLTENTSISLSSFGLSFLGLGNTQSLYIASSGYVGIGTTNPSAKLTIKGDSNQSTSDFTLLNGDDTIGLEIRAGNTNKGNIFIGKDVGNSTVDFYSSNNTAIGNQSFYKNTYGNSNTALGNQSLYSNVNGDSNTALGNSSLYNNTYGSKNIALGSESLYSNIGGDKNIALGNQSLYSNINGDSNLALGIKSLYNNISGNQNIAIGELSLEENISGNNNIAIGIGSLKRNTIGNKNIAIGNGTLVGNTSGNSNIAIGTGSLVGNTSGNSNIAIGTGSLMNNAEGSENTAFGNYSLTNNTIGELNTAMGSGSLGGNITGTYNTAIGGYSLTTNIGGTQNTAIGTGSLMNNANGSDNTAVGAMSLLNITTGSNNTVLGSNSLLNGTNLNSNIAIGYQAGYLLGIGSSNIFIGNDIGASGDYDNSLYIGHGTNPIIFGNLANGNIGIGTTNPSKKLDVIGDASISTNLTIGGSLVSVGSTNLVTNLNAQYLGGIGASEFVGIGQTAPFIYTATNGLTLASNQFKLGGELTETTRLNIGSTEVLYISSTGLIGIGTTNPTNTLKVFNSTAGIESAPLIVQQGIAYASPYTQYIQTWKNSAGTNVAHMRADGSLTTNNNKSTIYQATGTGSTTIPVFSNSSANAGIYFPSTTNLGFVTNRTERMKITDTGLIGIGTTNPIYKLDVIGDASISTNLTIGGSLVSVGSTNLVTNLNAQYLGGIGASGFVGIGQTGDFITTLTNGVGITITGSGVSRNITFDYDSSLLATDNKIGLNLASNNIWTALQTFTNGIGVSGDANFTNNLTIGGTLVSVGSTNLVTNLNAQYLGGIGASEFVGIGQTGDFITTLTNGIGITITGSGVSRNIAFDYNTSLLATDNKIGLNLASNNIWTGLQTFTNGIGVSGDANLTNNLTIGGTLVSVGSTNLVTNLNAQYLGGIGASGFVGIGQTGDFITSLSVGGSGLSIEGSGIGRTLTNTGLVDITNTTLIRSGSDGNYTVGLNLASNNIWTALQTFTNGIGVSGDANFTNNLTIGGTLVSVGSTNLVTNLNADLLDGYNSSSFIYTATNGLTLASNQFKLGGLLTQNTDIGLSGFTLSFSDGGNTLVSFSNSGNTFYNPTTFASGGDVSIAYNLNLTNSTGSNINTAGPISINAGETFNSSNLTLQTYNAGKIILNSSNLWNDGTNFGIGTTTPLYALDVLASGTTLVARFGSSEGSSCTFNGDGTLMCSSDSRLKTNINNIDYGLDTLSQLRAVDFNWKTDSSNTLKSLGFIAQEVESLVPKLVMTDTNGHKQLNTIGLVPIIVKSIQEQQVQIEDLKSSLNITSTGQINVTSNISDKVLASLGYSGAKNEIENASYSITNTTGQTVSRIGQFSQIASAKIKAGLISTTNLIADNLVAKNIITNNIVSPKATINELTAEKITSTEITADEVTVSNTLTTNQLITNNLEASEASVSNLYADNIITKDGSISDVMANKVSSLRDELTNLIASSQSTPSAISGTSIMSLSSGWYMDIASDSAKIEGDLALTNNLIVGAKLTVNGDTQLGNAFITGTFTTGEIAIKENFIETTNTALYLQPSNTGSVHIMGDTLVIADNGEVQINGDLKISGSLIANLITANEIQTDKLTTNELNSNQLTSNELTSDKLNIATDSASQIIIAESGFGYLATSSAQLVSNATAGTSVLPADKTELIIKNNKLTQNSIVYLTPVGSTNNQVVYLKEKMVYSETELQNNPDLQNYFIIALDQYLDKDITINWWIIN